MKPQPSNIAQSRIPFSSLTPFLIITFAIAWGILGLYIFFPDPMAGLFGQLSGEHPLFFLAVWAPAIAAFIIVLSKTGWKGLQRFVGRLLYWRVGWPWYLFLFIGLPAIFYAGAAWNGNLLTEPFPLESAQALLVALLLSVIKGPVEEFGWRGLALPLLQRKFAPFWAALTVGIIWGVWHLPAFLAGGTQQSAWAFMPFFTGTIAISIIITALVNASRGSILLAAFMHFQLINPIWPDAQPYDTYLLIIVAAFVVWFNRKLMFSLEGGITQVVPSKAIVE
jgi:membrane protease YdiL (CAAX protease family)